MPAAYSLNGNRQDDTITKIFAFAVRLVSENKENHGKVLSNYLLMRATGYYSPDPERDDRSLVRRLLVAFARSC